MSRLTMNFDAIAAASPQDATAASVRDGSGEHYDKAHPSFGHVKRWDAPPPMKTPRQLSNPQAVQQLNETVGRRFGSFVVLGILVEPPRGTKRATWVCRCDCGYYEGRPFKGLKSVGDAACCSHCEQTRRLRQMAARPSTRKTRRASARALDKMARGVTP